MACAAACTPSANRILAAGTLVVTRATLLACSMAAPAAWTSRNATSTASERASPHAADPAMKIMNP